MTERSVVEGKRRLYDRTSGDVADHAGVGAQHRVRRVHGAWPLGCREGGLARERGRFGRNLAIPAVIVLVVLLVIPSVLTVDYSFRGNTYSGSGVGRYVGLSNYSALVHSSIFWQSLEVTVIFAVSFVLLSTLLGLAMALLMNLPFRGRRITRSLLVIPWACPWVIIGIIWNRFASGTSFGGLDELLGWFHLANSGSTPLSNPHLALIMTVIAASWRQSCFAAMLILAGLQGRPPQLLEAAAIDGAGPWKRFLNVTLPWLRLVLVTVTVLNVIYGFLQFDIIYTLTNGGPGAATQMLSILMYNTMFSNNEVGTGSAVAVVLGLVTLLAGIVTVRLLYRRQEA